jgi:hypothetical protein
MSQITLRNLTQYELNVPRIDKSIAPQGTYVADVDDADNLIYDEDVQDLIAKGYLSYELEAETDAVRPFPVYANVAAFPNPASVPEGTPVIDATGGGAGVYLHLQVGGAWVAAN